MSREKCIFYSCRVEHCRCNRRGSRWFMVRAFGTLSTSEGGACFRKFAYIIKLRPMLRDSREWFVSPAKYFFHPIFFSDDIFSSYPKFIYIYYTSIYICSYITVGLNAFTRDDICRRFFPYVRGPTIIGLQ